MTLNLPTSNLRAKLIQPMANGRQSKFENFPEKDIPKLFTVMFPREIWRLQGAYWSLPISVEWPGEQREVAAIRIGGGIRLLDIQLEAAQARLKAIGAEYEARGDTGRRWWLVRSKLEAFCVLEGFVDPQSVVEWRPMGRIKYRDETNQTLRARDEFFYEFCKAGWMTNPYKAELFWFAFCKHALHWLVNEQKPVDMGFCQLVAVPLRANWKSILFDRFRKMGYGGFGQPTMPGTTSVEFITLVGNELLKGECTSWSSIQRSNKPERSQRPRHIYWTLECLPGRSWWRATIAYERGRRKAQKKGEIARYCRRVSETIKRLLPILAKLYANYISTVKTPAARISSQLTASGKASKAPGKKRGRNFNATPPAVVHPAYDLRRQTEVAAVEFGDPAEENCEVRDLPDLPPEIQDLRQSRIDVDQSHKPA